MELMSNDNTTLTFKDWLHAKIEDHNRMSDVEDWVENESDGDFLQDLGTFRICATPSNTDVDNINAVVLPGFSTTLFTMFMLPPRSKTRTSEVWFSNTGTIASFSDVKDIAWGECIPIHQTHPWLAWIYESTKDVCKVVLSDYEENPKINIALDDCVVPVKATLTGLVFIDTRGERVCWPTDGFFDEE